MDTMDNTYDQPAVTKEEIIGSGKRATSVDNATSQQPTVVSQNYFDELALESDDEAEFEFGFVLDDKHKSSSSPNTVMASARRATLQSTSNSVSQLTQQKLGQMKLLHEQDVKLNVAQTAAQPNI